MPNFSVYLPDDVLKALDEQRIATRSRVITKILQSCLAQEGYIASIKYDKEPYHRLVIPSNSKTWIEFFSTNYFEVISTL